MDKVTTRIQDSNAFHYLSFSSLKKKFTPFPSRISKCHFIQCILSWWSPSKTNCLLIEKVSAFQKCRHLRNMGITSPAGVTSNCKPSRELLFQVRWIPLRQWNTHIALTAITLVPILMFHVWQLLWEKSASMTASWCLGHSHNERTSCHPSY